MSINQTPNQFMRQVPQDLPRQWPDRTVKRLRYWLGIIAALLLVVILSGGSAITAEDYVQRSLSMQVAGWQFNLLTWEMHALREKIGADMTHPARALAPTAA